MRVSEEMRPGKAENRSRKERGKEGMEGYRVRRK